MPEVERLFVFQFRDMLNNLSVKMAIILFRSSYRPQQPLLDDRDELCSDLLDHMARPKRAR